MSNCNEEVYSCIKLDVGVGISDIANEQLQHGEWWRLPDPHNVGISDIANEQLQPMLQRSLPQSSAG